MTNINHVVIIGNITRDLDERSYGFNSNGNARANISIAVNRSKKVGDEWQDEVSYFDVTIWGKTAENLKPYLVKGQKVAIDGYLKQDRWEKDGQKYSKVGIIANSVELCGAKKSDGNSATAQNTSNYQGNNNQNYDNYGNQNNGFGEDIPF